MSERSGSELEKQALIISGLVEALNDVLSTAVILSEDYLSAFEPCANDCCIQGWEYSRWVSALAAEKKARMVIERAEEI